MTIVGDGGQVDAECLERVGGVGLDDPGVAQSALGRATLATEVAPDGSVWHAVVCVGVVRVDPEAGSASVLPFDDVFPSQLVTDVGVAPMEASGSQARAESSASNRPPKLRETVTGAGCRVPVLSSGHDCR